MTEYSRGGIARLQAEFLDHPQGQPVDPSSISLEILQGATSIDGPWTYPGAIVKDLVGLYHYDWSIPADLPLGAYTGAWTAVVNGVTRTGYDNFDVGEGFDIITGHPDSWTSPGEVLSLTGVAVTEAQLAYAQGVIDIYSGTTTAAIDDIGDRDLRLLKMAAGYQAVWQIQQVDVTSRSDVTDVSQDGMSFKPLDADALVLAPLARRCLERLSWLKSRALGVRHQHSARRFPRVEVWQDAWLRDEEGAQSVLDWRPL